MLALCLAWSDGNHGVAWKGCLRRDGAEESWLMRSVFMRALYFSTSFILLLACATYNISVVYFVMAMVASLIFLLLLQTAKWCYRISIGGS